MDDQELLVSFDQVKESGYLPRLEAIFEQFLIGKNKDVDRRKVIDAMTKGGALQCTEVLAAVGDLLKAGSGKPGFYKEIMNLQSEILSRKEPRKEEPVAEVKEEPKEEKKEPVKAAPEAEVEAPKGEIVKLGPKDRIDPSPGTSPAYSAWRKNSAGYVLTEYLKDGEFRSYEEAKAVVLKELGKEISEGYWKGFFVNVKKMICNTDTHVLTYEESDGKYRLIVDKRPSNG